MDFNVVRNVPQKQVTFPYENTFVLKHERTTSTVKLQFKKVQCLCNGST